MKKKNKTFDEKLIEQYFSEVVRSQNPRYEREEFLQRAKGFSERNQRSYRIFPGGMAASFGLLLLFSLSLLCPGTGNPPKEKWEKNLSRNITTIGTLIHKELINE